MNTAAITSPAMAARDPGVFDGLRCVFARDLRIALRRKSDSLAALVFFVPPNFLVLWAAQRLDPGRVGLLLTTEVLVGALSAGFLSGQPIGLPEIAGTAFIVTAGLVEVLGRR